MRPQQPQRLSTPPDPGPPEASPRSVLGKDLVFEGRLTGEEDLLIEGRVEGDVRLENHRVIVTRQGRVRGDIHARLITVEGRIEGDLVAGEGIVVRPSGRLEGKMVAPRLLLEDGARFRGLIDMEPPATPSGHKA